AVIPFDDDGRTRGSEDASHTSVAHFDVDCRAALGYLGKHRNVAPGQIGAAGFCLGGHLAFRAAVHPEGRGTACFYGAGIHSGKLGEDADAGSLQRAPEIRGELLLVWGRDDPHIPEDGRERIAASLREVGASFSERLYQAEHAFMRDEGARYDAQATDQAFGEMISLFLRVFPVGLWFLICCFSLCVFYVIYVFVLFYGSIYVH